MITQLLVADSDGIALERCRSYFLNRGFQVAVAADALQCLEALRRVPPDVMVLERELLWGGGDGVLACLRQERLRWPQTVILASSEFAESAAFCSLEPPVKAVLQRPYSLATLHERIRQTHVSQTHLAARFLRQAKKIPTFEQLRRERSLGDGPLVWPCRSGNAQRSMRQ